MAFHFPHYDLRKVCKSVTRVRSIIRLEIPLKLLKITEDSEHEGWYAEVIVGECSSNGIPAQNDLRISDI
jgi:hypothetical protein